MEFANNKAEAMEARGFEDMAHSKNASGDGDLQAAMKIFVDAGLENLARDLNTRASKKTCCRHYVECDGCASEKKKTTVATLVYVGVILAITVFAHFVTGKSPNLKFCSSLTLLVPAIGAAAAAVRASKASVAYDPKATALFDPKAGGAAHIAVRASVAFEPKTSNDFDPKTSDVFEPKTNMLFEPKTSIAFEPKTSDTFEPKTSDAFEPKTNVLFEPKISVAFEPKTSDEFEPKTNLLFEPKTSDEFEPKTSDAFDPKATGAAHIVARGLETSSTSSAPDVICYVTGRSTYPTPSAAFPTETANGVIATGQGSATSLST